MTVKREWGTQTVSFCLKVSLSASAPKKAVAARVMGRAASLGKLHQVALINKSLGSARSLAAGSRLLQLSDSHKSEEGICHNCRSCQKSRGS
jgi:hypothetical protein